MNEILCLHVDGAGDRDCHEYVEAEKKLKEALNSEHGRPTASPWNTAELHSKEKTMPGLSSMNSMSRKSSL